MCCDDGLSDIEFVFAFIGDEAGVAVSETVGETVLGMGANQLLERWDAWTWTIAEYTMTC